MDEGIQVLCKLKLYYSCLLRNIFPSIICECLPGTREEREFVIETIIKKKKFNVLVTSYEGLKNAFSYLMKIEWEYFVVDEGHKLKNEESLISIVKI